MHDMELSLKLYACFADLNHLFHGVKYTRICPSGGIVCSPTQFLDFKVTKRLVESTKHFS